MNRFTFLTVIVALLLVLGSTMGFAQRQLENLGRGLVAVKVSSGVFLSWRVLGTEFSTASYNIYRDGTKIATISSTGASNYTDASGTATSTYYIRPVISSVEGTACTAVTPWANFYKTIALSVPSSGTTPLGDTYTYTANDCSVGDLDGDGELEIVVKWDPSNSKDNSQSGYTGNVYLDAYEMDGTRKWRIDLGINVRAGAHYTQFLVYDFNGDGKAEVVFRGANGTKDNGGTVLGGTTDYRNSGGYILSGSEYLCVASGASGNITTYCTLGPSRGTVSDWGDTYGNRCDRFLAGVAYLNGVKPSIIIGRGYYRGIVNSVTYGQTKIYAYDYSGNTLSQKWAFNAVYNGANSDYTAKGHHQMTCADVDGDGYDEVVYGSCVIESDGTGKYAAAYGHGDMLNVGNLNPNRSGKEIWSCSEEGQGGDFYDAATGTLIWKYATSGDLGRALCADIDASTVGEECWASSGSLYSCTGVNLGTPPTSCNFAIWWDGDVQREILDGTVLNKWVAGATNRMVTLYNYGGTSSNNDTKSNPCLSGDILGDWREEVILRNSTQLVIYTTTTLTTTRMYTLLHDYQYRTMLAGENVAYNTCPRLSFYFGGGMGTITAPSLTLKSGTIETSVSEATKNEVIASSVSPNPANGSSLELNTLLKSRSNLKVEIFTIAGLKVKEQVLGVNEAGYLNKTINIDGLTAGMYLIKITTNEGCETIRFVRQ